MIENLKDIRLIAFDADDTLWDCQSHFDEVEKASSHHGGTIRKFQVPYLRWKREICPYWAMDAKPLQSH